MLTICNTHIYTFATDKNKQSYYIPEKVSPYNNVSVTFLRLTLLWVFFLLVRTIF